MYMQIYSKISSKKIEYIFHTSNSVCLVNHGETSPLALKFPYRDVISTQPTNLERVRLR